MKRKAEPIDAVDVAKFREAVKEFMDNEGYAYVVIRMAALAGVMFAKRKELLKRGDVPRSWIDTAATLPLRLSRGFDVAKFKSPKEIGCAKGQKRRKPAINMAEALRRIGQTQPKWIH